MPKSKEPMQYVFIFTYGRSGSTLLSGYLNALPDTCIRGENHMALANLWRYWKAVEGTIEQRSKVSMKPTHPWFGTDVMDLDDTSAKLRDLFETTVLNPPKGTKRVGFKEIRIQQRDIEDFDGFLDWVLKIFGDVKLVFNHRDIESTAQSGWWKHTSHAHATINAMDSRLRNSKHAKHAFHVEYEELIKSSDHAAKLAKFLGAEFSEDVWRQVMDTKHSY